MRGYVPALLVGLAAIPVSAQPAPPSKPAEPYQSAPPSKPAEPYQSAPPSKPAEPYQPAPPSKPAEPNQPTGANKPDEPTPVAPVSPTAPTSQAPARESPASPGGPPAPPPAAGPSDAELLDGSEVISIEHKSEGQVLRESARAITVVDTKEARKRASDLGEVLSRTQGIQVRREGGLGSYARFSLNGLYDDQVRFFLDGVPLHLAGWGAGIANVPVDLIQRVDIHRGVVPIALGADALGGAVDLATDPSWVSRAAASLEIGSFGTDRGSLIARARDADTGLVMGLSAFADRALNDYPIDVEVPDAQGRLSPARVRRFHDGYLAAGGSAELGVIDRGPLRRAIVRLFANQYDKELQHNLVMSVPYGEAGYGEVARGATVDATIEHAGFRFRALGGGARRRIEFHDMSDKVYDWFGNPVRERQVAGEIASMPVHQVVTESSAFGRLIGERALGDHQRLRIAIAPTATFRGGDDLLETDPTTRSAIDARRDLVQLVTGVEHELRTADDKLENVAFIKYYAMWTDAEDVQTGNVFVPVEQRTRRFGIGDGVRWRARPWLSVKASYEYATRMPSVDELFGNGILIEQNLQLAPEVSHNVNLEVAIDRKGAYGAIVAQADVFAREADDLIFQSPMDRRSTYQNVLHARILGIEGSGRWTAPGEWGWLEGSLTLQDSRNASSGGLYGAYEGDRIPNRPSWLGALGATVRTRDLARSGDELSVFASSRYVQHFFRGWESLGRRELKDVIPSQLVHGLGVTYALHGARACSGTLEVQNLTDTRAYDSFGVVRPGRAFFVKLGVEL